MRVWENVITKEILTMQPPRVKIRPLWLCSKTDGSAFKYSGYTNALYSDNMPSEFQYPFSNYTVRYEKFTSKMFWINNETGETYNEAPPNWDGPQVKPRDEVNWEELGQIWWGFIGTRLRRLTPAE